MSAPLKPVNKLRPLMVSKAQAAEMCGMHVDSFRRHVEPHLKVVRVPGSSLRRIPVRELEKWIDAHAHQLPEGL